MRKHEDIVNDAQKLIGYASSADRLILLLLELLLDIRDKV
jgi:hypothetical protein